MSPPLTHGYTYIYRGRGRRGLHGGPPGDLRVAVRVIYPIQGEDQVVNLRVSHKQAKRGVEPPSAADGTQVRLDVPLRSGQYVATRRGYAGQNGGTRGNFTINVTVEPQPAINLAIGVLAPWMLGAVVLLCFFLVVSRWGSDL
ncbi:DnaJ C-terminal domain-containing protein [Nocardioides palaemonis]|uniref:DnaJ C-terminal domain-containing protein n=1 Tax=Nocardioides palaemonis TaxID=2829810 RepID=UPI002012C04F|nr:DnaJ C-terminal domain-containing protein [Nocardioides palaemonis]